MLDFDTAVIVKIQQAAGLMASLYLKKSWHFHHIN